MAETKFMFGGDVSKMTSAAVCLEGDSDDYYQVDASALDMANDDTTGALMAWVMMADDTSTMTAIGYGDKDVVEFIELNVEAGLLTCRCTDNTTAQFVTQADGDKLEKHKWYHIAAVQNGDEVILYINGKAIDATHDTNTDTTAWFKECAGIDSGRIGAANKAGNDSVTQEWHGFIGSVRIYDDTEVKTASMVKAIYDYERKRLFNEGLDRDYDESNDTTGLLNHWDMTDLIDAGTGADNMTAVGGITLGSGCCQFTSRLWFDGNVPLVADDIAIAMNATHGIAIHLDAA